MKYELLKDGFLLSNKNLPFTQWHEGAPISMRAACATLTSLTEDDSLAKLLEDGKTFFLPYHNAAELPESEALVLGLPPRAPFSLSIQHRATLASPDFRFQYQLFQDGRPVISPRVVGCVVQVGSKSWRLSASHYCLIEGMNELNLKIGGSLEERLLVFSRFEKFLSENARDAINVSGHLSSTHVSVAGAFSLRLSVKNGLFELEPVLHANSIVDEVCPPELLTPEQHAAFLLNHKSGTGRYAVGSSHYLVVENDLQQALDLVAEIQQTSDEQQTQFFRNPRLFLREKYGESLTEETLDALFVETPQYLSDRVKGIGRWVPPVVPWVKLPVNSWLPPEEVGIKVGDIGDINVSIPTCCLEDFIARVEQAIDRNEAQVEISGQLVPATEQTLDALHSLKSLAAKPSEQIQQEQRNSKERIVLLIERDFDELGYGEACKERECKTDLLLPLGLKSVLKAHQEFGLRWLQNTWKEGRSGVLLADDMGLGKTLQCLSFMLWLRYANPAHTLGEGGILVVAPTGLLKNWEREFEIHFDDEGRRLLGRPLAAYGANLSRLRSARGNDLERGGISLRTDEIAAAGWVLTTYETMRDYHLSFAMIRWKMIVFDEVQKIKTPGSLASEAAKAMNVDFRLALTGTPVENRYADLWNIVNTVDRNSLSYVGAGSLREFSNKFEKDSNEDELRGLRIHLTEPPDSALMLRRMKHDILEGLPPKIELKAPAIMPNEQASLYASAVTRARGKREKGAMLKALHEFRTISLHPWLMNDEEPDDFSNFISASARVSECFRLLREIQKKAEKALIFVNSRRMQKWLRVMLPMEFDLLVPPSCISGEVPGVRRQAIVNQFQELPEGFAAMILSPRAAGVGLTLTAANHVIHLDRWWNPAVEDQCTDRVYRIGQEKPVQVCLPIANHPAAELADISFDLTLDRLMERKRLMSRDLLNPSVITESDAADLFRDVCGEC
jgi:hypothetical protein